MPSFTFCLETKSKQKIQGYARFAQKTGVHRRKSSKLVISFRRQLQTRTIFAPPHLFFGSPVNAAPICISRIHKNRTELSLSSLVKPDPEGQIGDTKPTESCLSE